MSLTDWALDLVNGSYACPGHGAWESMDGVERRGGKNGKKGEWEGGREGGRHVEMDGEGQGKKEGEEERQKTLKTCSQPKDRGDQELGLLPSHLRGLGRPVSHGDGHLVLGVAGREKPALLLS